MVQADLQEMGNGGLEAMLFDLLARPLGDWHPRQVVRTATLGQQQEESLAPLDAWWFELLQTGVLTGARGVPYQAISNAFEEEIEEEEGSRTPASIRDADTEAQAHGQAPRPLRPGPPDLAEAQGRRGRRFRPLPAQAQDAPPHG